MYSNGVGSGAGVTDPARLGDPKIDMDAPKWPRFAVRRRVKSCLHRHPDEVQDLVRRAEGLAAAHAARHDDEHDALRLEPERQRRTPARRGPHGRRARGAAEGSRGGGRAEHRAAIEAPGLVGPAVVASLRHGFSYSALVRMV